MLGDLARNLSIELKNNQELATHNEGTGLCSRVAFELTRATVRLDSKPLEDDDDPMTNNIVKRSNLDWRIQFRPSDKRAKQKKPFMLAGDLWPMGGQRYSGYEEFKELASAENSIEAFLLEYTYITAELFEIARQNPQITFHMGFDAVKYNNRLLSQLDAYPSTSMLCTKTEGIVIKKKIEEYEAMMKEKEEKERINELKRISKEQNSRGKRTSKAGR